MPIKDIGIGLRHQHLQQVIDEKPNINWFEVHTENFFYNNFASLQLEQIAKKYPISMHGVGLSIGSNDKLNISHLQQLKQTIEKFKPKLISEHLSWGSIGGNYFNDLLPLPYTKESLKLFSDKVKQIQDFLGQQILIENPSSYLQFAESTISEWDFFTQLPNLSGCGLLLDINNIFVSSKNHDFDPIIYLSTIDASDIQEIHLAGFSVNSYEQGDILIDDHSCKVKDKVWDLYKIAMQKFGKKPTLIEWDTNIPALSVLISEAQKAKKIING